MEGSVFVKKKKQEGELTLPVDIKDPEAVSIHH